MTLKEDEYLNESDGLIYCSKCHTPRQCRVQLGGKEFRPSIRCRCQQEAYEQQEKERKQREFLEHISRLKASGLQDKALRDYNFSNDKGYNPEIRKAHEYVAHWKEMKEKSLGLLQPVRYYQISQKITTLTEEIEELLSQKERLIYDNYFHSEAELKNSESVCQKQQDFLNRLDQQYETLSIQLNDSQECFQKIKTSVSPEKSYELLDARSELRDAVREQTRFTLQERFGQKNDSFRFSDTANAVDERLSEDPETFRERAFRKRMEQETMRRQNRSTGRVNSYKEPER